MKRKWETLVLIFCFTTLHKGLGWTSIICKSDGEKGKIVTRERNASKISMRQISRSEEICHILKKTEDKRSSLTIFLKWHRNWEMDRNLHEFFDFIGQVVATVGIKMCPRWSEKQSSDECPQIKDGDGDISINMKYNHHS